MLAKTANKIAKKFQAKTNGLHIIDTDEKRIKALKWQKVEDIWGIGRKHTEKLKNNKIYTAFDFSIQKDEWVLKYFSIVELKIKKELTGEKAFELEVTKPKKAIATTRSFNRNYTELQDIKERIITFASSCAEKLRAQHSCCRELMVFIYTNGFREDLPQYNKTLVIKLPYPTQSTLELAKFAASAVEYIYRSGFSYKKAGVVVLDLIPEDCVQLNLFYNSNPKHPMIMQAMDKINLEYGTHCVKLAAQDLQKVWKMNQAKLSPRYTTRLEDIITIHT